MARISMTGKQFGIFMGVFAVYATVIAGVYAYTAKKNMDNYEDAMWTIKQNATNGTKTILDKFNHGAVK